MLPLGNIVLGCHGDKFQFKTELYYLHITEINIYNRNEFCIHAFLHKNGTGIAPRSEYL